MLLHRVLARQLLNMATWRFGPPSTHHERCRLHTRPY